MATRRPPHGGYPPQAGGWGPAPGYGPSAGGYVPPGGYGPPQPGYAPPGPGYGPAGFPQGNWTSGPGAQSTADLATVASRDPEQVFLLELLMTGLLGLPGVGTLLAGDTGLGIALLLGYPTVIWGAWAFFTAVTCGIGALLIFLQIPINFVVGYFLGNRARTRVNDARRALGRG